MTRFNVMNNELCGWWRIITSRMFPQKASGLFSAAPITSTGLFGGNNMHVLIVTQYFWPEDFRINNLALGLKERASGHGVDRKTELSWRGLFSRI